MRKLICAAIVASLTISNSHNAAAADGRWLSRGGGVVEDTTTNLQWTQRDNRANVSQPEAQRWCEGLGMAGGGWRLPSTRELTRSLSMGGEGSTRCQGLVCRLPPIFELTGSFAWTADASQMGARRVNLVTGSDGQALPSESTYSRALCVRSVPDNGVAAITGGPDQTSAPAAAMPPRHVASEPRFQNAGTGVLVDRSTGLQWTQRDNGQNVDQFRARRWCEDLAMNGGGWHLPESDQLQSLLANDVSNKCGNLIPCKVSPLFAISEYRFWSNTRADDANGNPQAFIVSLTDGKRSPWVLTFPNRVICTRQI